MSQSTEKGSKKIYNKTPKPYRALNFTWKTSSLSNRAKFDGPNGHSGIIKQIVQDAKDEGYDTSYSFVERTIGLFFKKIITNMRHGNFIVVDEIGSFGMTPSEKKRCIQADEDTSSKRAFARYGIND